MSLFYSYRSVEIIILKPSSEFSVISTLIANRYFLTFVMINKDSVGYENLRKKIWRDREVRGNSE